MTESILSVNEGDQQKICPLNLIAFILKYFLDLPVWNNVIIHLQDVSTVIRDCYWFENYTWWRITKKAPCLPDVIYHKKSLEYIDKTDLVYLGVKISDINSSYCPNGIKNISKDAVLLERKN